MSQIEITNVSVEFKQKNQLVKAVNDVSLAIEKGTIFGIVGLSGAGKSTLVRTINALQQPTSGSVVVDGVDVTHANGKQLRELRKKIGFIFQNFNLINNRTVAQNIEFALTAGGYPEKQQTARVNELLKQVGLEGQEAKFPGQLSGGQKQRVGIARALANEPDILLCDEATSALDVETAEEIVQILKGINERLNITIVFITHQLEIAKDLFDQVAVMENGELVEQTSCFELFAKPQSNMAKRLVDRFLSIKIPEEVKANVVGKPGSLLTLKYRGDGTLNPIITQIAKDTDVQISILQGRIEFIHQQAIGVLSIFITGAADNVSRATSAFAGVVDDIKEER